MISRSVKMPFILQEEIARLGNASDYQLFVLKSHIENITHNNRRLEELTAKISIGVILNYFDPELLKEDQLLVTEIGRCIKGTRQSDTQTVSVEPQSVNFEHTTNISSIDEKGAHIKDEWQLPSYHRVVVDCYNYVLKGYFIKYNHNGSKLKLLGGETIKLPSNAIFYEPTPNDIEDFIRIEQDPLHQNMEYERTLKTMRSKIGQLAPSNNPIDYRKLLRFMIGRGFMLQNIEKAIEEVFGKG